MAEARAPAAAEAPPPAEAPAHGGPLRASLMTEQSGSAAGGLGGVCSDSDESVPQTPLSRSASSLAGAPLAGEPPAQVAAGATGEGGARTLALGSALVSSALTAGAHSNILARHSNILARAQHTQHPVAPAARGGLRGVLLPTDPNAVNLGGDEGGAGGADVRPAADAEGAGGQKAGWNQFEANATQFGVNTTFDESMYTTQLSQARTAEERAREREAARLAREIQAEAGGTAHQAQPLEGAQPSQAREGVPPEARPPLLAIGRLSLQGAPTRVGAPPPPRPARRLSLQGAPTRLGAPPPPRPAPSMLAAERLAHPAPSFPLSADFPPSSRHVNRLLPPVLTPLAAPGLGLPSARPASAPDALTRQPHEWASAGAAPQQLSVEARLPSARRGSADEAATAARVEALIAARVPGMTAGGRMAHPWPHAARPAMEILPQPISFTLRPVEARMLNVHLTNAPCVESLLALVAQNMHVFNAVNASTAMHKTAKLFKLGFCGTPVETIVSSQVFHALCALVLLKIESGEFGSRNLANSLWAIATLKKCTGVAPILRAAATECCKRIATFNCQELANTIWSYASLSFHPGNLLCECVATAMVARSRDAKPQELSNAAWAFATLGVVSMPLFEAIAVEAEVKLAGYNSQNVSNTCWAYATLGIHPKKLFDAVAAILPTGMSGFNPQALSNTAWAFSSLGHYSPSMMDAIAREMLHKLSLFNRPQAVGNCLWSFASLKHHPGESFLREVTQHSSYMLGTFQPADVSMILWSLATLDFYPGLAFLEGVAVRTQRIIYNFGAHELANVAFAFGQLGHHPGRVLLASIAEQVVQTAADFNPLSLSILLLSFGLLDEQPSDAMTAAVGRQALASMATFSPLHLTNFLWAHAHLRADPGEKLLDAITQQVRARLQEFQPAELANLAWSYGRLGVNPGRVWLEDVMGALEIAMSPRRIATAVGASDPSRSLPLVSATQLAWGLSSLGGGQHLDRVIDFVRLTLEAAGAEVALARLSANELCMLLRASTVATREASRSVAARAAAALAAQDLSTLQLENVAEALRALTALQGGRERAPPGLFAQLQHEAINLLRPGVGDSRADAARKIAGSKDATNTTRLLWSSANSHRPGAEAPPELLAAAASSLEGQCCTLHSADEMSCTLWSFAKMGYFPGERLCGELCQLVRERTQSLSPTHAACMMWALAEMRFAHPAFDATAEVVAGVADRLPWASVCMAARACAKMEPAPRNSRQAIRRLLRAAAALLAERADLPLPDDLAALCWSAAMSDVSATLRERTAAAPADGGATGDHPNVASADFSAVWTTLRAQPVGAFSETALARMAVAWLLCKHVAPALGRDLAPSLHRAALSSLDSAERRMVEACQGFRDEVKQALAGTGVAMGVDTGAPDSESLTSGAGVRAPLTVVVGSQRVAFVLETPNDLCRNTDAMVGHPYLRCLLLELSGWAVVQLRAHEWRDAGTSATSRLALLEHKLRSVSQASRAAPELITAPRPLGT